jgi:hypothetical protein
LLRLLQAHVLVGGGEIQQGIEADCGLFDSGPNPVQGRRLEDRRVHDAFVREPLNLMQQHLALLAVALLRLLAEQVVDLGI